MGLPKAGESKTVFVREKIKCGAGGVSERDQRCEQLREATVFAQKSVQEK